MPTMKIRDVQLSILRTELGQEVIPTKGAVDKMPQLVLVSVSTHEGIDGHYISYLIPSASVPHAAEIAKAMLIGRDTYDVGALSREMTTALPSAHSRVNPRKVMKFALSMVTISRVVGA